MKCARKDCEQEKSTPKSQFCDDHRCIAIKAGGGRCNAGPSKDEVMCGPHLDQAYAAMDAAIQEQDDRSLADLALNGDEQRQALTPEEKERLGFATIPTQNMDIAAAYLRVIMLRCVSGTYQVGQDSEYGVLFNILKALEGSDPHVPG